MIDRNTFADAGNLEVLHLENNLLDWEVNPPDIGMFQGLSSLTVLRLGHSSLVAIPVGIFAPVAATLVTLDLRMAGLTQDLPPDTFTGADVVTGVTATPKLMCHCTIPAPNQLSCPLNVY